MSKQGSIANIVKNIYYDEFRWWVSRNLQKKKKIKIGFFLKIRPNNVRSKRVMVAFLFVFRSLVKSIGFFALGIAIAKECIGMEFVPATN